MLKCLAKDPDDRYLTAGELRDALNEVLSQADNLAKTESVQAKQPKTEIASANKTPKPVVIAEDAPTTSVNWEDTEAIPKETNTSNPMMMYAGIAVIAIIILAGLFFFRDSLFGGNEKIEPTAIAEVIVTEEATAISEEATDIPPEPTAVPEEPTDIPPEPTAVPFVAPEPLEPIAPPHEFNLALLSWDINPDDARNLEYETEQLLFDSQLQEALEQVNSAIGNDETAYIGYAAQTRIALARGNRELAVESAEFMYQFDTNNPNGHINLLDALYMSLPNIDRERASMLLDEGQALAPEDWAFVWRRIPLVDDSAEKMALFNQAENEGARGWRFVLFAGDFLFEQGEYQRAIPYLEAAIHLPPDIFSQSGQVNSQLRYAQAQLEYMTANPDYPLSLGGTMPPLPQNLSMFSNINEYLNETEVMVLEGNVEDGIALMNTILEDDPDNFEALFARAQLYAQNWDPDNLAGQDAQRLIELQPNSGLAYLALADSWFNYPLADEEGSFEEGFSMLERAFELAPENPHILFRFSPLGDWELEAERMLLAENLGASGYRFIFGMGAFLHATGQYHRAIPYLEAFTRYTEQGAYSQQEAFWRLLGALTMVEDSQSALDLLLESNIMNETSDSVVFTDAAYIAYSAKNYDLAEEWANTALAFSSEAYAARWILGNIAFYRDGNVDLAFEHLETAFNEGGNENDTRYLNFAYGNDLNLERARVLNNAERYEDAIDYYNEILAYYDYTDWLYEERANAHLALGDSESARQDLQTAFDIAENPDYRAYLRDRIVELGPASDG